MLGLYGSVVIIYNKWVKYYVIQSQEEEAIVTSSFIETIKGINTIKI